MPLSSHLAPGFIRMTYSGLVLPHHMVIPIQFAGLVTPGVTPTIGSSGGTDASWKVALSLFVSTALAPCYHTGTKFGLADIYKVDATTGERTFIDTYNVSDEGTATPVNVNAQEGVFVFKSSVGKPIKVYLMESIFSVGSRNIGSVPADGRADVVEYILSDDNIFYGRTDAWPLAFQTFTSKTNDVLRRRQGFSDV